LKALSPAMCESSPRQRLNSLLNECGFNPLSATLTRSFEAYLSLLLRWNARVNLTAIRDTDAILTRHFLESIACARVMPAGIATLLDFGSGAGFPGIPIALCRPEIAVTLAESNGKKAAFLHEVVRTLEISARVHAARAESLPDHFDCVTLRAVDEMKQAVQAAARLVGDGGWLALMTTRPEVSAVQEAAGSSFSWRKPELLPSSEDRVLALATRNSKG
jgi:16S rRNA (guanine527-N7)-methyltransferase